MIFSNYAIEELLPSYLSSTEKDRIKSGLEQFFKNSPEADLSNFYKGFYSESSPEYLLQFDIFNSIKSTIWNESSEEFENGYSPAVLISNACDVSLDNTRTINRKDCLFAPVLPLTEYIDDLKKANFSDDQLNGFLRTLKRQEFSNLIYFPSMPTRDKELIIFLDKIFWNPLSEVEKILNQVKTIRYGSLSNPGFYLAILKLSFHFCRLPENTER